MNFLNPALTGRAFLYFAYPAQISGDAVWVAVDGYSQATPLAAYADPQQMDFSYTWWESFVGLIPGSMGETSTLCCLLGAAVLILTRVGSWQIMAGVTLGMVGSALFFNWVGSATNPMFNVSPAWHFVIGGFAFGTVFMATDPGQRDRNARRQVGVRRVDRRDDRVDPRDQPGLSRRHYAGDFVRQCVRAHHRPRVHQPQYQEETRPCKMTASKKRSLLRLPCVWSVRSSCRWPRCRSMRSKRKTNAST